jgi:hypothetical protein
MVQVNILQKNNWQDVALKLECNVTTFLQIKKILGVSVTLNT